MNALLALLSTTEYQSGEWLCQQLGMTRAAVWKRMEKLRDEGYRVVSGGKKGYRLEPDPDSLLPGYIQKELHTLWAGQPEICYRTEMASTNLTLKQLAMDGAPHGTLCVCEHQTAGRGRLSRTWTETASANLLQSLLVRPTLAPSQAQLCTLAAAVAMAQAITDVTALPARIKWPNDIVIHGRKAVGILSEMAADPDALQYVIVGVGTNVNQPSFDAELKDKATSLLLECGHGIDRRALLCAYLTRMEAAMDMLERGGMTLLLPLYSALSVTLGSRIEVISQTERFTATADALDETGALLATDENGTKRRILSGDVSVRGVMGYV